MERKNSDNMTEISREEKSKCVEVGCPSGPGVRSDERMFGQCPVCAGRAASKRPREPEKAPTTPLAS